MILVKTKKGRFLVKVNNRYGCYVNADGTFVRSVEDIEKEMAWAKENWEHYKEEKPSPKFKETVLSGLKYVAEYKATQEAV